ncbi:lysozyme inhibitor LprI family protein [Comamonas sp. Tr-654]|uniref:lysozyme inhibitor LprI family protein n=1 Tax=Comamonas sp. Tr-654 TaxID=2608341 RepID=UPI001F047DF2|nr:lysozyme inhibitor LprI family protein [Comamonas sp. Tr-654]
MSRFPTPSSATRTAGIAARPLARLCALAVSGLLLIHLPATAAQDGDQDPPDCPSGQPLSLACLQQQAQVIERSMQVLYLSLQRQLPQASAQALQAEQEDWTRQRDRRCQPNGYVHEAEDMAACRIGMALSRVVAFKNQWHPLAKSAQGGEQP